MVIFYITKTKTMPKLSPSSGVKVIRAVTAVVLATIPPFQVVFFGKDSISLWGQIKVFFFKR
tara:strand:+ start:528 stop:713 length:186 start_codon:yes stop_codon:yes gene_type:complete